MFNSTPNIDSATVVGHDNKTQAERGTGKGKDDTARAATAAGSDSGGAHAGNLASNTYGYPCAHT